MNQLPQNVKNLLGQIGYLCLARSLRREMALPVFDLSFRIWWNIRKLKKQEAKGGNG